MKKYFRVSIFLTVLALMIIAVGQPRSLASMDKAFDPACLATCQQRNLECFFGAVTKSDQRQCTAEYRRCVAHCK